MAGRLSEFLRASARERFVYGSNDCAFWVARWLSALVGYQVAASELGKYHDVVGCVRFVKLRGGLVRIGESIAQSIGATEVRDDLREGDVAAIDIGRYGAMAIWTGKRFAIKAPVGVTFCNAPALKVWRA